MSVAGVKGLRTPHCFPAALASGGLQCRHLVKFAALGNPADVASATPTTTPEAAAAASAAKRTSRAVYWFMGVAAAAVLGTLSYPQLVTLPPTHKPAPLAPPPVNPPSNADLPSTPMPSPSPREELTQRLASLRGELAELRKQNKNQVVNMKKRAIKDEMHMIESGLRKLDKA